MTLALMALTTATAWADSTFSGGNGSQGNPYQIATTAEGTTGCGRYGGIAGYNDGPVAHCIYLGTTLGGLSYVGAIAGFNHGTATNCYFTSTAIQGKNYGGANLDNANSAIGCNSGGTVTDCGLAPNDNADNTGFFALMAARTAALNAIDRDPALSTAVDITLSARTLTADNWNTLCVPFALSSAQIESIFGAGTLVKTLSSYANNGTTVTVTFISADEIVAGTPYIIMPANTVANPEFTGVTIDNTMHDVTAGDATFKGIYSPVPLAANDKKKLFLADNMLWYPNADVTVRACRAYFELDSEVQAREFVLNFGDGEETGIVSMDNGQWIMDNEAGAWYTLDGRKLSQKPIAKGLYINNGKKVVVK